MNEEMLRKYAPMLLGATAPIGNPGDTGSGILMGMAVGAAAINMHEGFISLPYYPPSSLDLGHRGQRPGPAFHERGRATTAASGSTACSSRTGACT